MALESAPMQLPTIDALPAAERRRAGLSIKLAMALAFDAVGNAGASPATLSSVFSSTGGDCENCNTLLETLATEDRAVSPTRFHNSVHNGPSGYWSIATACMSASTSLCAYDATFAAGLIEAATQVAANGQSCLLVAFDTPYPQPLAAVRPIPSAFGVAMVLGPAGSQSSCPTLRLELCQDGITTLTDPRLEALRLAVPAARSLPVMQMLAACRSGQVVVEYLEAPNLAIGVRC
jgi:hypothetical protein